jgi:hypothetical protein
MDFFSLFMVYRKATFVVVPFSYIALLGHPVLQNSQENSLDLPTNWETKIRVPLQRESGRILLYIDLFLPCVLPCCPLPGVEGSGNREGRGQGQCG